MQSSKITAKGQVTIPQTFCRLLDVKPGDKVGFEASDDGQIIIRKIDCRISLSGVLRNQITRQATDQEIDEATQQDWSNCGDKSPI